MNGKIVFSSDQTGNYEIWTMNPDGSNPTRLTNTSASTTNRYPAWSPDGSKIAFSSTMSGGGFQIWVMNADGTGQSELTNNASDNVHPAWSPDGSKIAFSSTMSGGNYKIFVMNADGTGQTGLTDPTPPLDDQHPTWSPDGTRIEFDRGTLNNDEDIWVMNADGSGQTQVTSPPFNADPYWSSGGAKVTFESGPNDPSHNFWNIFVMNPDGTGRVALTNDSATQNEHPAWSPDGAQILWDTNRGGGSFQIWVMNADGTGQRQLTNGASNSKDPDQQRLKTTTRLTVTPALAKLFPPQVYYPFLYATLTDQATGLPVPGQTITFTTGGHPLGSATTDAHGTAQLCEALTFPLILFNGGYDASFAGTRTLQPATAHGTILEP